MRTGGDVLASTRCGIVEGSLDLQVLRGLIVGFLGFRITPVADVAGVDGERILPRILVLGDPAIVRDEHERRGRLGTLRTEIANPSGILDTPI
ncbi:hypothetical protein GCM10009066_23620 [Halarchaeum salinum]|uniref:Uncharacterized protein n=1 Tax=Halarchaeum salinum TaxID=489912 RepID=A0AAV3SA47_9EURY